MNYENFHRETSLSFTLGGLTAWGNAGAILAVRVALATFRLDPNLVLSYWEYVTGLHSPQCVFDYFKIIIGSSFYVFFLFNILAINGLRICSGKHGEEVRKRKQVQDHYAHLKHLSQPSDPFQLDVPPNGPDSVPAHILQQNYAFADAELST